MRQRRPETGYRRDGWKQLLVPIEIHRAVTVRAGKLQAITGEQDVAAWRAIQHAFAANEEAVNAEVQKVLHPQAQA